MALLRYLTDLKLMTNKDLRIVLGSQSPRRKELLGKNILGGKVPFEVIKSTFEEDFDTTKYHGRAKDLVVEYAKQKALNVRDQIAGMRADSRDAKAPTVLIIGCDTVIEQDGVILEKPNSKEEAKSRLMSYSERSHSVISGVCILCIKFASPSQSSTENIVSEEFRSFFNETKVTFGKIDEAIAEAYIATNEPMDKAGGYGIQGIGASLIEKIDGCYYNVVGLPVRDTSETMHQVLESSLVYKEQLS